MKKSKLKELIQIPLAFHHQDIHERLDEIVHFVLNLKALLVEVKVLLQLTRNETMARLSHNGRANYSVPEPTPKANNNPSIHDLVIQDIQDRKNFGLQKYGTTLQAGNGRKGLVDAYQEALDLCCYLKQVIEESLTVQEDEQEWM